MNFLWLLSEQLYSRWIIVEYKKLSQKKAPTDNGKACSDHDSDDCFVTGTEGTVT